MTNQQGIRYTSDRELRCPNDGSILRGGGKCMACGFLKGKTHPPRVVVEGLVYDADQVPQELHVIQSAVTRFTATPDGLLEDTEYRCGYCGRVSASRVGHGSHMRAEERKRAEVNV